MTHDRYIDSRDVSVADSWVVPANKTGVGNGEAKLYVGQRSDPTYRQFFGPEGYVRRGFVRRSVLIKFMTSLRTEYLRPTQHYRSRDSFPQLWTERYGIVESLADEHQWFEFTEQAQLEGHRAYINSRSPSYELLRTLAIPDRTALKIIKWSDDEDEGEFFEFRLDPDFEGAVQQRLEESAIEIELQRVLSESTGAAPRSELETVVQRLADFRIGQQRFRKAVLRECGNRCAFTAVTDPSLLVAGHIKPWAKASSQERLDSQNGFAFTPTYDRLFNNGLISFTDDRKLLVSPLLSVETTTRLGLVRGSEVDVPLIGPSNQARRHYLEFHRTNEFRS